jgi:hypothetical protein
VHLTQPAEHLVVYHLAWRGRASLHKHEIGRRRFGDRVRDTQQQCATFCDYGACFFADQPYFCIGQAREYFHRSHRIERSDARIEKNGNLKGLNFWIHDRLAVLTSPHSLNKRVSSDRAPGFHQNAQGPGFSIF